MGHCFHLQKQFQKISFLRKIVLTFKMTRDLHICDLVALEVRTTKNIFYAFFFYNNATSSYDYNTEIILETS